MPPEEMTLSDAIEELRSMARSLDIDLPSDAGYVERLNTIADFLDGFGNALTEGMRNIASAIEHMKG